jgi:hypothetical protein
MPRVAVQIKAPNFKTADFEIKGNAPLVIHRFSAKIKKQMLDKMEAGKVSASRKNREAKSSADSFNEARYISRQGWDGFNASAIRNAMISACRLVNFKMTLAKMSVFIIAEGVDKVEPQIPLIQILGCKAVQQEDFARVETGSAYVTIRAAYHGWSAKLRVRWDNDQFNVTDISNLLMRVGQQVGIGEGRPDSKNSAGMGWGTFDLVNHEDAN